MKRILVFLMVAVLAVAGSMYAAGTTKTKVIRSHGKQSYGTVSAVDDSGKSFTLKSKGADQTIYWTEGTKVQGGTLKTDERVTVRWMEKDGKKIATSIRIAPAKAAAKKS